MKKQKNPILRFTIPVLLFIVLIYACKREITMPVKPNGPVSVQWAKSYFEHTLQPHADNILKPAKMMSNGRSGLNKPNRMKVDWDKAFTAATLDYDFVETPIQFDRRSAPVFINSKNPHREAVADPEQINASFDRLIIYKNEFGQTSEKVVTYIPDEDYYKKHNGQVKHNRINKLDRDFNGYLQYRDWDGSIAFMLRIENGIAVKRMVPEQGLVPSSIAPKSNASSGTGQAKMMNYQVAQCDDWTIRYEWEQWCYYPGDASTPAYCDPPEISNVQVFPNCPGGGGGTGNNNVDCTDPTNFDNGKCQPANMVPIDTANKVDKPCLVDALTKALGKDAKSKIKNLMDSTFLVNSNVNLTFYSLPVPTTSPNAEAIAYARQAGNNPSEQMIVFNENKTGNRSKEYLVATVYHEMLHAYLGTLVTKDANGDFIFTNQHEKMVTDYLNMMKQDLRSIFPGMSEPDALGLAWGGLEGTSRYNLLTPTEKYNISQINNKYSTKPGPGVTNSAGTYCN